MKSHSEAPSDSPNLNFSEEEKIALKAMIQEKIVHTEMTNSMSVGLLFNNLAIAPLPHLPYSLPNILAWNQWLLAEKGLSIETVRSNTNRMPLVYQNVFHEFLKKLINLGLLSETTEIVNPILAQIIDILSENKPSL